MNTLDLLWYVWPWTGFGIGIAIMFSLFFSKSYQDTDGKSKFKNPTWIAWVIAAAYLIHVLEEYGMHVENGQYELITSFVERGIDAKFGGIPLAFFPYLNMMLTWVALPVAAVISKRNPVIGLSGMGFLLVNALTHIMGSVAMGISFSENAGVVTGLFLFIPIFIWAVYACKKEQLLPSKGLAIAIISGVIGHMSLFLGYILNMLFGHGVTMVAIPIIAFMPIIAAWVLCKIFHISFKEV